MSKKNEIILAIFALIISGTVLFWSIKKLDSPESLIPIASISSEFPNICILFQNSPVISLKANILNDQMASLIIKGEFKLSDVKGATGEQTRSFQGYLSFNPIGYLYEAALEFPVSNESKLKLKLEGTSSVKIHMGLYKDEVATQEKEVLVNGPILHSSISEKDGETLFNILFPAKLSANLGVVMGNLGAAMGGSESGIKPEIGKYVSVKVSKDGDHPGSCNLRPINGAIPFSESILGALGSSMAASEQQ